MPKDEFKNLLRILRLVGGKFIIIEDGRPSAVLMDYKEFEDLVAPGIIDGLVGKMGDIELVNRQITKAQLQDLREEVLQPDFGSEAADSEEADPEITIEPLEPF